MEKGRTVHAFCSGLGVSIATISSFLHFSVVPGIRRVGFRAVEPLALGSTGKERMRLGFEA